MTRRFTKLLAAFALLVGLTIPLGVWGQTRDAETITFADLGLENGVQYTDPFGTNIRVTFAGGENDGKYYTTGSGIRTYGGGTITITANDNTVTAISTTFSGVSYAPASTDVWSCNGTTTNSTSGVNASWSGSATEVVMTRPSGSGHWRMQAITVTYTASGSTPTTYNVTVNQTTGGTIAANPTQATAGTTITLTATPAEGYNFDSWNITPNTVEINNNQFTMPASDVTVSAQWMENTTPGGDEQWVLTNLADLTTNDVFVIVGNNGSNFAMSNNNGTGSAPSAVAVTVADNAITSNVANTIQWTISGNATDGYTFYPNGSSSTWLYCTNTNNGVRVGSGDAKHFKLSNDGYLTTTETNEQRFLGIYSSQDWRCYTSSGGNIANQTFAFYKKVTGGVLPPSITAEDVNIPYDATSGSITYTITNGVEGGAVTSAEVTASNPENWLTVNGSNPYASPISLSCAANATATEKTATVTLTYTYNRETVTETVNVTQAADPNATMTIAEVRALNTGTTVATKGVVTSISVSGNNKTAYFQDNTAGIVAYGPFTTTVAVGDEIRVEGELTSYNGLLEIGKSSAAPTVTVLSQNNTVTPVVKTIAEISNIIQAQLVKVENATVTAKDGQNTTIAQGQNTIVVRGISGVEYAVNDILTLTANVGCYNNNPQLVNPQNVEVQVVPVITYLVNFSLDGGTFVPNNVFTDAIVEIEAGTYALPSATKDGFTFAGWYDGTNTYQAGSEYSVSDNIDFTAQWVVSFNVTYDFSSANNFYTEAGGDEHPATGNTNNVDEFYYGNGDKFTASGTSHYFGETNAPYFLFGKSGALLNLPSFANTYKITKITLHSSSSGSQSVQVAIVSGENIVADAQTWESRDADYIYTIPAEYQESVLSVKVVSSHNAQITAITLEREAIEPATESLQKTLIADRWYIIASPFAGTVTTNAMDASNLYFYDEQDHFWRSKTLHENDFDFASGTGYLCGNKNDDFELTFEGTVSEDDIKEIPLKYHATTTADVDNPLAGWNLVGNPFATTAAISNDYYIMNEDGDGLIVGESNVVDAMQGVFVKATPEDQTVIFEKAEVGVGGGDDKLVVNLSQNRSNVIDRAIVRMGEGRQLPKFQLFEGNTKLYIPQDGQDYAVVRSEGQGELPVNFRASENGTYTLSMDVENMDMNYLHLIDNMTGMDIDLLQTPSYTFEAKVNDYESRFRLVFAANNEDGVSTGSTAFAFYSNGSWIINNAGEATLQVVDLTGRILSSETVNGSVSTTINAVPGVYMLRLINGDNVNVQKIVVR